MKYQDDFYFTSSINHNFQDGFINLFHKFNKFSSQGGLLVGKQGDTLELNNLPPQQ